MKFEAASFSEAGPRAENEDAVSVHQFGRDCLAVAVADGLGGMAGGALASRTAVQLFVQRVSEGANLTLLEIVTEIHRSIRDLQSDNPRVGTMATTFSAAILKEGRMFGAHCGDSRISVARGAGIKKLTVEHTEAYKLLLAGKLTKEEYADYPRKNILESALGIHRTPKIDTFEFDLKTGDRIFFTTDGLHTKILLRELLAVSSRCSTPSELCQALREEMTTRQPNDNYSFIGVFAV